LFAKIVKEAQAEETTAPAAEVVSVAPKAEAAAPEAKGDDLTKIKGIGKVYAGKLNGEGFHSFADVANMTAAQITVMEEKYSFKGDFKESVAHAKELAEA